MRVARYSPEKLLKISGCADYFEAWRLLEEFKKYSLENESPAWSYQNFPLAQLSINLKLMFFETKSNLKELSIVELGCGTTDSSDQGIGHAPSFPWMSRFLQFYNQQYQMNLKQLGLDNGFQDEKYPYRQIDLMDPNALGFIEGHSIDLVVAFQLFNSPILHSTHGTNAGNILWSNLYPQVNRILKPEAIYISRETDI
jgi:hypothetical protein